MLSRPERSQVNSTNLRPRVASQLALFLVVSFQVYPAFPQHQEGSVASLPFSTRERLSYQLFWPQDLPAGLAELEVRETTKYPNTRALHFVVHVRSTGMIADLYPINNQYHSYAERDSLNSLQYEQYLREGQRNFELRIQFDQDGYRAIRQPDGREMSIPADCKDPIAAFYALRRTDWSRVDARKLVLNDGRKNITLVAKVTGRRKKISIPAGSFLTTELTISPQDENGNPLGRGITAWLTEEKQIPVLIVAPVKFGVLRAELRALP